MGIRTTVIPVILGATLIFACACGCGRNSPTIDDTPRPDTDYVGHDAHVALSMLQFQDPVGQARFTAAQECFTGRHAAGVEAGQQWRHYSLSEIGNSVKEDWCRGRHSRGCAGGSFRTERGDEWYQVSTLHYDSSWPQVFGIGVSAGQLPRDGEWGVSFSYWANGANLRGDGMGVSYYRFQGSEIVQSVNLGDYYSYKIEEDTIFVQAPGDQDAVLARLARSPESLRATAVESLDELLAVVVQHIQAGMVRKCVYYGPYQRDGIPPVCTLTPLTQQEQDAAVVAARAEIEGQRAAVEENAERFHTLLTDLMVFDKCWGTPLTAAPSLRRGGLHVPEGDGEACPYYRVYALRDAQDELRSSFYGEVSFWTPVDEHRLLIGLSTCRDPATGKETSSWGAGDAWQELLEVTIPDEGEPSWRLLLRTNRGDMGCKLSPDGTSGACAVRHGGTLIQDLLLLDLSGPKVETRPAECVAQIDIMSSSTKPRLRYRNDQFEVELDGVEAQADSRWVALRSVQEAR